MGGVHPEGGELHHLLLFHHREGQPPGENGAGSDELRILRDIALKYFGLFSRQAGGDVEVDLDVIHSVKLSDNFEQLIIDHRNTWHPHWTVIRCSVRQLELNIKSGDI